MENPFIEAAYPIAFRSKDAKKLGEYLRQRRCVDLVGMKRVGISNFLRFFLYHKDIVKTYINHGEKHVFIPIDLNDLIERELFPFWILTFKRIVDKLEDLPIEDKTKKLVSRLFLDSIQAGDMFLTLDGIRKSLVEIVKLDIAPTLFFIRFDRLKDAATPEFFNNLQGLRDASAQKISYVFTSYRNLNELVPNVFKKEALSVFSHGLYIKAADYKDIATIFDTFKKRYQISVNNKTYKKILELCGGQVQYLQLSLIILKEAVQEKGKVNESIEDLIFQDERINLQSEELWESLNEDEKKILLKINNNESLNKNDRVVGKYLWDTGIILEKEIKTCLVTRQVIFSPIFEQFLKEKSKTYKNTVVVDFTNKENLLFGFLKSNLNELCDREKIIETVWSEYEELGVSDWAVDRLVARVRTKIKNKQSPFEIVTVKTRGYKLISK